MACHLEKSDLMGKAEKKKEKAACLFSLHLLGPSFLWNSRSFGQWSPLHFHLTKYFSRKQPSTNQKTLELKGPIFKINWTQMDLSSLFE